MANCCGGRNSLKVYKLSKAGEVPARLVVLCQHCFKNNTKYTIPNPDAAINTQAQVNALLEAKGSCDCTSPSCHD